MTDLRDGLRRLIDDFFPGAGVAPMAGDASDRRFFRVSPPEGPPRVLMDYGKAFEDDTDDVVMTRVFEEAGLPVAAIVRACPDAGCLVLEDLGDLTLESAVDAGTGDRDSLYARAVELLVEIAGPGSEALARSPRARGPALDAERFRFEMDFFVEHFAGGLAGVSASPRLVAGLHDLADRAARAPVRVLCHRDFHARNLMVRPDGSLAMVDIQDARWGPDTYDLASLLRDAYLDVEEARIEGWIESYRSRLPNPPERGAFLERFDVVAAQRMIKALGTFGYQIGTLGRTRYGPSIARTVARLAELLPRSPRTAPLGPVLEEAGLLAVPPITTRSE
jgi:aminoglycoside/choline kinase family phosphotransferase